MYTDEGRMSVVIKAWSSFHCCLHNLVHTEHAQCDVYILSVDTDSNMHVTHNYDIVEHIYKCIGDHLC